MKKKQGAAAADVLLNTLTPINHWLVSPAIYQQLLPRLGRRWPIYQASGPIVIYPTPQPSVKSLHTNTPCRKPKTSSSPKNSALVTEQWGQVYLINMMTLLSLITKITTYLIKKIMFLIWPVALQEAGDYFLRILVNETSLNTSPPSMVMAHPIKYIQIRRISDCSTILKSIILQMFGSIYNHFHLQQEQHFQLLCVFEPAPSFSATVLYIHTICILQKERFLAPIKQILLHCTNK